MPTTEIPKAAEGHEPEVFDAEIQVRPIVLTMVWVFGTTVVSMFLMWGLFRLFEMTDPNAARPMMPIEAMNKQPPPPRPWLEGVEAQKDGTRAALPASPYDAFDEIHKAEDQLVNHSGWIDKEQGVVRMKIDDALDVVAAKGLAAPAAAGTAGDDAAAVAAVRPVVAAPAAHPAPAPPAAGAPH